MSKITDKPPVMFAHHHWQRQRDRAAADFADFSFLKELAAQRLAERLEIVKRSFVDILDYGCHSGQMGQLIKRSVTSDDRFHLVQADISPAFVKLAEKLNPAAVKSVVCSNETLPVEAQSCDLIVSALYLHWMNDLPGILTQARLALRPDGLFMANLLGGRSLHELRACLSEAESEIMGGLSPRCMPMADIRDLGGLLQRAGFSLPVADAEILTLTYPDIFRMMADLRGMGGQNALSGRLNRFTPKQVFLRAAELYQERFSTKDGQIKASIELITLTGWAPDSRQPTPLPRGQADRSFTDMF